MSTMTANARGAAKMDRRVFTAWVVLIWALVLFGFGADFARYIRETPPPPLILHVHGLLSVAWLGLVTAQILLAQAGRIPLHRTLGWATIVLSAAMVPLGFTAAMVDMARHVADSDYAPQFLGEEFQDILGFALCTVGGVVVRKNRPAHSRFMLLAAVALMDVGPGRISSDVIRLVPGNPFEVWFAYYWGTALLIVGMLAWDLMKHRRVHGSLALGAAVLWGGEAVASAYYFSPWWKAVAAGLVRAWGWAG